MPKNNPTRKTRERRPSACIDFDGVLAEYHGWRGADYWGKPMPGVKLFLQRLVRANVSIIVYTTRTDKKAITAWFKKYKLPRPDAITHVKIPATIYIDDRAIQFDGDWTTFAKKLQRFTVYWKEQYQPFKNI